MKSKKGAILFSIILVVFLVAILLFAWSLLSSKYSIFDKNIGQRQYELINTYQKAEKTLFYTDQSAKYSLQHSLYELAQNGGAPQIEISSEIDSTSFELADFDKPTDKDCKSFYGYSIWYELKKDESGNIIQNECTSQVKIKSNLEYLFDKNLNQYLVNYPEANILTNNYVYETNGNLEITGRAMYELKFDILKDESKPFVKMPEEIKMSRDTPDIVDLTGTGFCKKGERCLLAKNAYELLLKSDEIARQKLKDNRIKNMCLEKENTPCLEINDAYRTLQEQIDVWEGRTPMRWAQRIPDPNLRKQKVCYPYGDDVLQRCPHLTPYAVDVRLKGKTSNTMTKKEWQIVHEAMTSNKYWVRYGDEKNPEAGEPWHFECCGTIRYARAQEKGITAIV